MVFCFSILFDISNGQEGNAPTSEPKAPASQTNTVSATSAEADEPTTPPASQSKSDKSIPAEATPKSRTDKSWSLDSLPAKTRYLLNKQGILVEIPASKTLEDFLEFSKKQTETRKEVVPTYTISSMELTGDLQNDRVEFLVRVSIRLSQSEELVRVPLKLNEAVLLDEAVYTGEGEFIADKPDADRGLVWWFRGRGPHQLEMKISVPVRNQLPSKRLQLSLPQSSASKLTLVVPYRVTNVKTNDETPVELTNPDASDKDKQQDEATKNSNGKSQIELFGVGRTGQRVDLTWQPFENSSPIDPVLEANSTILATIDSDSAILNVQQRIQALQGVFDSVTIQLPIGAEILKVEGEHYRQHRIDAAKSNRVTVSLNKSSTGPVRLNWTVRLSRGER
ncbi:MAG: hypothetical protein FJ267_07655, partial [Planctomycetes bacterium]|nr:hypothetical protein [Planctomycetota bacterium]